MLASPLFTPNPKLESYGTEIIIMIFEFVLIIFIITSLLLNSSLEESY